MQQLPEGFDNNSVFSTSFHSQTQQSHARKVGHERIVEMDSNCIYFTSGQKGVLLHFCSEILAEGTHAMMLLFSKASLTCLHFIGQNLLPS